MGRVKDSHSSLLLQREGGKDNRHAANVEKADGSIIPLVEETLGVWTPYVASANTI